MMKKLSCFFLLLISFWTPISFALSPENRACQFILPKLIKVKIRYWGFDDKVHVGTLIVHESLGAEIVEIFNGLFKHHFPIQSVGGFNCRAVTDQKGILSQHAYGRAIDINPKQNPYVKEKLVIPSNGKIFISRIDPQKGKIIPNTYVIKLFARYGWDWGGNWLDLKDYQHFEKRAHGKKRDPFGYPELRFGMLFRFKAR